VGVKYQIWLKSNPHLNLPPASGKVLLSVINRDQKQKINLVTGTKKYYAFVV
jgi:hypothetical protein